MQFIVTMSASSCHSHFSKREKLLWRTPAQHLGIIYVARCAEYITLQFASRSFGNMTTVSLCLCLCLCPSLSLCLCGCLWCVIMHAKALNGWGTNTHTHTVGKYVKTFVCVCFLWLLQLCLTLSVVHCTVKWINLMSVDLNLSSILVFVPKHFQGRVVQIVIIVSGI